MTNPTKKNQKFLTFGTSTGVLCVFFETLSLGEAWSQNIPQITNPFVVNPFFEVFVF
jgi:hypothetical protein